MSSKWTTDDEAKSGAHSPSSPNPNSPPSSERKDGKSSRRPRRPRPGRDDATRADDMAKDGIETPPVKAVAGGWGLDAEGSTTSDAQSKLVMNIEAPNPGIDGGSTRAARRNHFDNDETEILVIPDLEDDGEEDIVSKVAVAPKNTTRRVPTLRELDEDLKYSVPSAADGLDMSLLTKTLVPPEMLEEDDSPWDFDSLLQAVTQEFNAEKCTRTNSSGQDESDDAGGNAFQGDSVSRLQGGSRSSRALVA